MDDANAANGEAEVVETWTGAAPLTGEPARRDDSLRRTFAPPMPLPMSRKLADRLATVAPSATLAMAAHAARLRAEGHKVYAFGVGEPDFDTPLHVRNGAKAA